MTLKLPSTGMLCALAVLPAASGLAGIVVQDLGTVAPPATLGGYTMTQFPFDDRVGQTVTSVNGLGFSHAVRVAQVGVAWWATWSQGYSGNVYPDATYSATSLTMTLPSQTGAFYFYAEPDPFAVYSITAAANDGTTLTQSIDGNAGARGFGFYTTGGSLASITVTSATDFAVGEFGISAVPEPSTYLAGLSALGMLGVLGWRSRK